MVTTESAVRAEDARKLGGSKDFYDCLDEQCITRVNAAVLKRVQKQVDKPKENCKVSLWPGSQWSDDTVHIQEDRELRDDKTTYHFQSRYTVTWQAKVSCTCHMEVLGGIPCLHIIKVALHAKKRIPLSCFHQRFYTSSVHLVQCGQIPLHLSSSPLHQSMHIQPPSPQAGESDDSHDKSGSESSHCRVEVSVECDEGPEIELSQHQLHISQAVLTEKLGEKGAGFIIDANAYVQGIVAQHLAGKPDEVLRHVGEKVKEMATQIVQQAAESPAKHIGHAPHPH